MSVDIIIEPARISSKDGAACTVYRLIAQYEYNRCISKYCLL